MYPEYISTTIYTPDPIAVSVVSRPLAHVVALDVALVDDKAPPAGRPLSARVPVVRHQAAALSAETAAAATQAR